MRSVRNCRLFPWRIRRSFAWMATSGKATMVDMTHDETAVAPQPQTLDRRTRLLLEGPIVATLLRMSGPNILVMVAQASTGLIETYFIGKLGIDALAGVALVFPGLM